MSNCSMVRVGVACVPMVALLSLAAPAAADDGRFEIGLRAVLTASDGEPANDIPGYGLFGRYRLNDRWSLGFSVDQTEYDFEEPAKLLGLQQSASLEPIDTVAEATVVAAWIERDYVRSDRMTWFWGLGAGLADIDVPDASGPLAGGGRFDIQTEADTEMIASVSAGLRRRLASRLFFEFAVRADQHFADWKVTDRVSGATGAVDDYLALGGHLGFGFSF